MELDQHFVIDRKVLLRIVELAKIQKDEVILEIGAGTGNLTKLLVKKAKKLYAIEKDKNLFSELKKISNKNLKLIPGDALKVQFPDFDKLVANLPYSISEPLIQRLIYEDFKLAVLLLPENFVKIISGEKRTKLTEITKTFFELKLDRDVKPESFSPKPRVFSRIIVLIPKKPRNEKELIFMEFLKQTDKKAKNALREAIIKGGNKSGKEITKKEAKKFLRNFKIDKKVARLNLRELEKIKEFIV